MDLDGLPIIGPGIDFTKVEAIHQKRTLAFLNHFIANTVSFLNRFSKVCERKLEETDSRLQRIEALLSIVEAKLSSIPGLENLEVAANTPIISPSTGNLTLTDLSIDIQQTSTPIANNIITEESSIAEETINGTNIIKVKEDKRFAPFFKMLHFGVPSPAVKLKMQVEGLDPNLLDMPDAPAPPTDEDNEDSSSLKSASEHSTSS